MYIYIGLHFTPYGFALYQFIHLFFQKAFDLLILMIHGSRSSAGMDHGIWYWPFFITKKKEVIVR